MSIFDNYDNLSSTYVPNNQKEVLEKQNIFIPSIPRKEFDSFGNFLGYSWSYGDTLSFNILLSKTINVEENALIYDEEGEGPNSSTVGVMGQRAYNTVDIKSWTCKTLDQTIYNWVEDKVFKYPKLAGTKEINLETFKDIYSKKVLFTIKNFREETIYSKEIVANKEIEISIDKELSNKLLQGIYYAYVTVFDNDYSDNCLKFLILIKDCNTSQTLRDEVSWRAPRTRLSWS
jgi:hypothetical protein